MYIYVISGIVFAATGLIMLLSPEGFVSALVVSLGVAAFASGAYTLVKFRAELHEPAFRKALTVRALLGMTVGLVAVFMPLILAGTVWVALSYLIAGYLVISAGLELYGVIRLRKAGLPYIGYTYESVASIAVAIILFIFPGTTGIFLVRISGALVLVGACAFILRATGVLRRHSGT